LLAAAEEVNVDPQDRPELCATLNTLANLHAVHGELTKAVDIAESAVAILRELSADSRILLGSGLMFLAGVLTQSGQYTKAVSVAEEGVKIYSAVMGENHSETARMRAVLTEARQQAANSKEPR
jgi:hypothetical protein